MCAEQSGLPSAVPLETRRGLRNMNRIKIIIISKRRKNLTSPQPSPRQSHWHRKSGVVCIQGRFWFIKRPHLRTLMFTRIYLCPSLQTKKPWFGQSCLTSQALGAVHSSILVGNNHNSVVSKPGSRAVSAALLLTSRTCLRYVLTSWKQLSPTTTGLQVSDWKDWNCFCV